MEEENTFHLGITMAGAVSAGAYTAGFIDYLIEILEFWEKQKKIIRKKTENNEPLSDYE
jgi:Cft2 family RNA processing exonuclease